MTKTFKVVNALAELSEYMDDDFIDEMICESIEEGIDIDCYQDDFEDVMYL